MSYMIGMYRISHRSFLPNQISVGIYFGQLNPKFVGDTIVVVVGKHNMIIPSDNHIIIRPSTPMGTIWINVAPNPILGIDDSIV